MAKVNNQFLSKYRWFIIAALGILAVILGIIFYYYFVKPQTAYKNYQKSFSEQAKQTASVLEKGDAELLAETSKKLGINSLSGFNLKSGENILPDILISSRYAEPMQYGQGKFRVYTTPINSNNPSGRLINNKVVYSEVFPSVDSVIYFSGNGLKEDLVFKNNSAPTEIRWKLATENLTAEVKDNRIILKASDTGEEIIKSYLPKIISKTGGALTDKAEYSLDGEEMVLKIQAQNLEFPFLLDPGWEPTEPYVLDFWSTWDMTVHSVNPTDLSYSKQVANQWPGPNIGLFSDMASDGRYVYLATSWASYLNLAKIDTNLPAGSNIVVQRTDIPSATYGYSICGIALQGTSLYLCTTTNIANIGNFKVFRVNTTDLSLTAVTGYMDNLYTPGKMASDGTFLYIAAITHKGNIPNAAMIKVNPATGVITSNLDLSYSGVNGLTYRNGKLYFWNSSSQYYWVINEIDVNTLALGPAVTDTMSSYTGFPSFLITDGYYLYVGWYAGQPGNFYTSMKKIDITLPIGPGQIVAENLQVRLGGIGGFASKVFPYIGPFTTATPTTSCVGAKSAVNLSWTAAEGTQTYQIQRKVGTGAYSVVGTVNAPTTTFQDQTVTAGTTYTYLIVAYAGGGIVKRESTNTVSIKAKVCDFSVVITPSSQTKTAPATATYTVTVTSNGFAGDVVLTFSSSPAVTSSNLNPTTVTLSAGNSKTSTLTVTANSAGTYALTVTGTGGGISKTGTATLIVTAPSPTCNLTANPSSINSGQSSTLTWTTTNNPTSASINQGLGTVTPPTGGTKSVSPTSTLTYTLTVTNAAGSGTCNATVTVISAPTCGLTASPSTINPGQSSTLSWTTTNNPTSASIDNGIGNVTPPTGGSISVSPASTTTYTMTVTSGAGSNTCNATVTVVAIPVPTCNLSASPNSLPSGGGTSTLTWTTTNTPTSASINQGVGTVTPPTGGTKSVSLTATTTYTMTVTNAGGSNTCSTAITVAGAPSAARKIHVIIEWSEFGQTRSVDLTTLLQDIR